MKRRGRSTFTHSVSAEGPKGKLPPALPWQGPSLQYRGNGNQHPRAAPHHPRAQPGSDPGAEGAGREPLSSLTQRCRSSRHVGSVQGRLGAVVCSPASARQELPQLTPLLTPSLLIRQQYGCSLALTARHGWMEARSVDGWPRALSDCFPNVFANTRDQTCCS